MSHVITDACIGCHICAKNCPVSAIIGNIKEQSFEEIMNSDRASEVAKKVAACDRNCAFIVTERHDMVRRPWKPVWWIVKNKIRIARGKDICW